jgi:hypothetical protein
MNQKEDISSCIKELIKKSKTKEYGLKYIVKNKFFLEGNYLVFEDGPSIRKGHYDCLTAAIDLKEKLKKQNIESKIFYGKDQNNIFENGHCFLKIKNNIIDPSGFYSFLDAKHEPIKEICEDEQIKEKNEHYHIINNKEKIVIRAEGDDQKIKATFLSIKYPIDPKVSFISPNWKSKYEFKDFDFIYTLKKGNNKNDLKIKISNSKILKENFSYIIKKDFDYLINNKIISTNNKLYNKIKDDVNKDKETILCFIKRVYEAI